MGVFELIKPTKERLFLAVIIVLLVSAITYWFPREICSRSLEGEMCIDEAVAIGYPSFYGDVFYGDAVERGFLPGMFVVNLLLWYLVSCAIISVFKKVRS